MNGTCTKLSIAEVKRQLPVGTEFTAEYCGPCVRFATELVTRRRVVKQTGTMTTRILTGSKAGHLVYCEWHGVVAREECGSIVLTNTQVQPAEDFLRITL